MMEMEVAVENNRAMRGRLASVDFDNPVEKTTNNDKDLQYKPPQMCKVALIGDSTVGKTSLCEIFCKSNFNYGQNYNMTFGVEIYGKTIKVQETGNNSDDRVNLIVADSSGKDVYTEFLPKYWDKLDAIALMIDLTSGTSMDNCSTWMELAKPSLNPVGEKDREKGQGVLIGNKCDMTEQRVVSYEAVKQFANENRLEYFECSVRQNFGIEEPFLYLGQQWLARNKGNNGKDKARGENEEPRRRKTKN